MDSDFQKRFKALSPEVWELYGQNKKLWGEIFNLGRNAERMRLMERSDGRVAHWLDGRARA